MGALTGQTIAASYEQLLHVDTDGGGATTTLVPVKDGDNGTTFCLQLATTSALISGSGSKLLFSDNGGEYISGDGTNLTITSGGDIILALGATGSVYHTGDGGTSNTIYGKTAGDSLASGGNYNALIGENAGTAVSTGDGNIAIGFEALKTEDAGSGNVAVGYQALETLNNDNGYNIAMGHNAMQAATTAYYNICIGKDAGTAMAAAVPSCVIIGHEAGDAINHADAGGTVAIGRSSGGAITSGQFNTAVGYQSLESNAIGNDSTAVGYQALQDMVADADGHGRNTAIGSKAGLNLIAGTQNVFVGFLAAGAGTVAGDSNIAIGVECGENLGTANENTFIGTQCGRDLTTGSDNVAMGVSAFDAAGVGESYNVAIGSGTMGAWDEGTEGGSAQVDHNIAIGYNAFLGGDCGGGSEVAVGNIAIGSYALDATSADNHTGTIAIGYQALTENLGAAYNTAIGYQAGYFATTAASSTFIGFQAAKGITSAKLTGNANTVIGDNAGLMLQGAANENTIVGRGAAIGLTVGTNNVAIGGASMGGENAGNAIIGSNNVCIGYLAGYEMQADTNDNTLVGTNAGQNLEAGDNNTAIGKGSLVAVVGGDQNVCAGVSAGATITSGAGNICIGVSSDTDDADRNGCIAIGQGAVTSAADNSAVIGDQSYKVTLDFSQASQTWAATSDERIKKDVVDSDLGLDFVNKLRPIKYKDIPPSEWPEVIRPKKLKESHYTSKGNQLDGLIAQEVIQVVKDLGVTFSGCGSGDEPDSETQMLQYSKFVVPLIKAVQELSAKVKALEDAQ
jgi:hypothetical protein